MKHNQLKTRLFLKETQFKLTNDSARDKKSILSQKRSNANDEKIANTLLKPYFTMTLREVGDREKSPSVSTYLFR